MITHKQSNELIEVLHKPIPEHLIDFYQVMKFCGEEIDSLNFETESYRYTELNRLWFEAADEYVFRFIRRMMN